MENWNGTRVCRVFAAGQNASGELGLGLSQNVVRDFAQVQLPGGSNCELLITAAACGGGYSLVFDALNCRTYTCGEQDGVGGLSKPKRELVPLPALCGVHLIQLSCGLNHSLALTRDGAVLAWGRNADGQCGASLERSFVSTPSVVQGLRQFRGTHVACGAYHSLVATRGGEASGRVEDSEGGERGWKGEGGGGGLFAFGWNNYGQLGTVGPAGMDMSASVYADIQNKKFAQPLLVALPAATASASVVSVAGGGWHSLCTTRCGRVFSWGCNNEGQLGTYIRMYVCIGLQQ